LYQQQQQQQQQFPLQYQQQQFPLQVDLGMQQMQMQLVPQNLQLLQHQPMQQQQMYSSNYNHHLVNLRAATRFPVTRSGCCSSSSSVRSSGSIVAVADVVAVAGGGENRIRPLVVMYGRAPRYIRRRRIPRGAACATSRPE
jgi:hypothetical protein